MWIYEQVLSNSIGKQQQSKAAEEKVDKSDTFGLTSGDEDSACSVPPPPSTPPPPYQLVESEGVEIDDVLNDSQMERQASNITSKYSKSSVLNAISLTNSSASNEEEQGAIEVEAAGAGFSRKSASASDSVSDRVAVRSTPSEVEVDLKARKREVFCTRKCKACVLVVAMVALLLLIGGLTYGAVKNSKSNERTAVSALTRGEDEDGVDIVDVDRMEVPTESQVLSPNGNTVPANTTQFQDDQDDEPIFETTFSPDTPAPSPSGTEAGTVASTTAATTASTAAVTAVGTDMPTEISCSSDHNLVLSATCENDGFESWSAIRILYCFSSTRDGDWYWIRGVDTDYDRWDYTEGSAEGLLDFASIPAGNYLVSLVRDSMQPYDILLTEELVIPNCDTVAS